MQFLDKYKFTGPYSVVSQHAHNQYVLASASTRECLKNPVSSKFMKPFHGPLLRPPPSTHDPLAPSIVTSEIPPHERMLAEHFIEPPSVSSVGANITEFYNWKNSQTVPKSCAPNSFVFQPYQPRRDVPLENAATVTPLTEEPPLAEDTALAEHTALPSTSQATEVTSQQSGSHKYFTRSKVNPSVTRDYSEFRLANVREPVDCVIERN